MTKLYVYAPEALNGARDELKAFLGAADMLPVLCSNTAKRVRAHKLAYLEYGPYWWAVKRILNANGFDLGAADNAYWAAQFTITDPADGFESAELTLIAAWECADEIRATLFRGARDFALTDDSDEVAVSISLFDPDMEEGA